MGYRRRDADYDAIQGRFYNSNAEKQRAFRDRVAADPDVKAGVTISHRTGREGGNRLKTDRSTWDLNGDEG
jgi:hypothetical protein